MKSLAIITGGTSGIGLATAERLVDRYHLLLIYRERHQRAQEAAQKLSALSPSTKVHVFACDISRPESAKLICDEAGKTYSCEIEVLINSAGRSQSTLFIQTDPKLIEEILNVHLYGMMRLTQEVLFGMYRRRYGRIINISSMACYGENRGLSVYASAKAGVESFTKALSTEVFHRGININAIRPGFVRTPMTEELLSAVESTELRSTSLASVVDLIIYLLSPEANRISGRILEIESLERKSSPLTAKDHVRKSKGK